MAIASLTLTPPLHLFRGQSNWWPALFASNIVKLQELRLQKWCIRAVSKINALDSDREGSAIDNAEKGSKTSKRSSRGGRKKATADAPKSSVTGVVGNIQEEESNTQVALTEEPQKVSRRGRKKATLPSSGTESVEKKVRRRTKKKVDDVVDHEELSNLEVPELLIHEEEEEDLLFMGDEGEDISFTYAWPPLVCCFGAAQHAFIPSGRPANRLIDHQIHEAQKDVLWSPERFVRAPGGSSSNVALSLASIGGRVAFMGKIGADEYGESILYHLNVSNVQTRSVKIDSSKPTAVSHMKITRRGGLKMTCLRPCAEDSLSSSEINIDVIKEAKMFYFNSSSLLDPNMRRTTLQAIKASKKLGSVIFFDLNLPLTLWHSREEAKVFIQQAWNYADIIEVTKQELEFLCGIEPIEKFDTKDNDKSKFIHHQPEVIKPLWHDSLQVLFVTNGTSKIHYYTEKDNGWLHGMEDAPVSPFTSDMSVSGDAIVAALMRMLTVQPDRATDKSYLEHMIKYAINCGITNQWMLTRVLGYPPKEGMPREPAEPNGLRSISEREYRTVEPVS